MNGKEAQLHTKGWLTGSISSILETEKLYGCYYYDYYHNLIQTRNTDINGKIIVSKSSFNFRSQPIATSEEYEEDIDIRKNYLYDHAERLVKESHNIGKKTTHFAYSYDELGKIRSLTRIHGKDSLATVNEYNIRNWLIKIQSPAFKQQLHYTDSTDTPCYNGNISSMTWQNDSELIRGYSFSYDKLARLKDAIYGEGDNLNQNSGHYNEQVIDYDRMGNILELLRYGQTSESNYGLIDNLHLTYDGNCLQSVYDNATNQAVGNSMEFKNGANETVEYEYDSNGNLTKYLNKKISCIQYNILNSPSHVLFEDGNSISYIYDANGTKLRTTHITGNETTITDYIGSAIYENGVLTKLLTNQGHITLTDTIYHYFIQDHQGNNRVVVDQNGNVEEVNHYYPFGGVFASTSDVQPYKYNGKELDRKCGLDWYDYGARMYDPAIGRFTSMDPMYEKYCSLHPYMYCLNNPVRLVDPTGKEPTVYEAALMAKHVYGDKVELTGGWMLSGREYDGMTSKISGFKSALYERTIDGVTEYTLATAGTQLNDWGDIKEDITQLWGDTKQYGQSVELARTISSALETFELTYVGHSLGGGLAAANALATDKNAITFNPAAISTATNLICFCFHLFPMALFSM